MSKQSLIKTLKSPDFKDTTKNDKLIPLSFVLEVVEKHIKPITAERLLRLILKHSKNVSGGNDQIVYDVDAIIKELLNGKTLNLIII